MSLVVTYLSAGLTFIKNQGQKKPSFSPLMHPMYNIVRLDGASQRNRTMRTQTESLHAQVISSQLVKTEGQGYGDGVYEPVSGEN